MLKNNKGQALLVVVMILGATMLGVTTIAGYITVQKIRTVTDIVDSTKAIYAADSGIDWWFYKKFVAEPSEEGEIPVPPQPTFSNNAELEIRESETIVKSIGHSGRSYRAFGAFPGMFTQ